MEAPVSFSIWRAVSRHHVQTNGPLPCNRAPRQSSSRRPIPLKLHESVGVARRTSGIRLPNVLAFSCERQQQQDRTLPRRLARGSRRMAANVARRESPRAKRNHFSQSARPRSSAATRIRVDRSAFHSSSDEENGARDMHPPATNLQCRARDAYQLSFAPAGVPLPVTNTQGQPRYRLSVLPSLGSASHVPPPNSTVNAASKASGESSRG